MRLASSLRRCATIWVIPIACLLLPAIAAGQAGQSGQSGESSDGKLPPAGKDVAKPDAKPGKSSTPPPEGRERPRSGERIRLDAPVSFPVDI